MQKIKYLVFIALFAATALPAQALIFFEPGIGYQLNTLKQKHGTTDGVTDKELSAKLNGLAIDVKAGVDVPFVYFGPYLNLAFPGISTSNGWAQLSPEVSSPLMVAAGVMVGVKVPVVPLKAWVGYQLVNEISLKSTSGTGSEGGNDASYKGKGFMAGLGYEIKLVLPISFNVQYHNETYDTANNVIGNNGNLDFKLPALITDSDTNFSDVYLDKANAHRFVFFVSVPLRL